MILNVLCFLCGVILSGIIVKLYCDKSSKEELIMLRTKLETFESLEKMIKLFN